MIDESRVVYAVVGACFKMSREDRFLRRNSGYVVV
jgi:hypothetical protein